MTDSGYILYKVRTDGSPIWDQYHLQSGLFVCVCVLYKLVRQTLSNSPVLMNSIQFNPIKRSLLLFLLHALLNALLDCGFYNSPKLCSLVCYTWCQYWSIDRLGQLHTMQNGNFCVVQFCSQLRTLKQIIHADLINLSIDWPMALTLCVLRTYFCIITYLPQTVRIKI